MVPKSSATSKPTSTCRESSGFLIAHIVSKHHECLRQTLSFIRTLAAKVSRVHGGHNPKLLDLEAAVEEISRTLLTHLDEEEQSLFPALVSKEPDRAAIARPLS